jgi:hypothetical protein
MRLLNVFNGNLEEFPQGEIPRYAILSHTWETQELAFRDMLSNSEPKPVTYDMFRMDETMRATLFEASHSQHIKDKVGYYKIRRCAAQAFRDGLGYIWVDTCCIDKTSSTELSESINSKIQHMLLDWQIK